MALSTNGDSVIFNTGNNPLVKYNFMLRVEALFDVPCISVKSFTRENEFEYIQEGGLNDYVHMRRKPISRPFTLVVERYAGTYLIDPLQNGTELALPLLLFVTGKPGDFTPGSVKRTYTFTGCVVTKKTYGELSSSQSGFLTEEIEIAYREFVLVDLPIENNQLSVPNKYDGQFRITPKQMEVNPPEPDTSNMDADKKAAHDIANDLKNKDRKYSYTDDYRAKKYGSKFSPLTTYFSEKKQEKYNGIYRFTPRIKDIAKTEADTSQMTPQQKAAYELSSEMKNPKRIYAYNDSYRVKRYGDKFKPLKAYFVGQNPNTTYKTKTTVKKLTLKGYTSQNAKENAKSTKAYTLQRPIYKYSIVGNNPTEAYTSKKYKVVSIEKAYNKY